MTLIEVIVAMVIMAIAMGLAVMAFGAVTSAETRQGASDVATAVRYTYNLSAINNRVYALYLDLDAGTYQAAPFKKGGDCERLMINVDGSASDPIVTTYGKSGDNEDDDDDEDRGLFDAAQGAQGDGEVTDAVTADTTTPTGQLMNLLSSETKSLSQETSRQAGIPVDDSTSPDGPKRVKSYRKNQLGKPRKLPKGVKFAGVLLREDMDPVTEGKVPILFYPHGFTQRALIYLESGEGEDAEVFTVEVMSLAGLGRIHDVELDASNFKEDVN